MKQSTTKAAKTTDKFRWHPLARVFDLGGNLVPRPSAQSFGNRPFVVIPEDPAPEALGKAIGENSFCIAPIGEYKSESNPAPIPAPNLQCLSSGSTGAAKHITRTQGSWIKTFEVNRKQFGFGPKSKTVVLGALSHSLSAYGAFEALWHGMELHLVSGLRPDRKLAIIGSSEITHFYATPAQLQQIITAGWRQNTKHISSVNLILVGGAQLTPDLRRNTRVQFPNARIVEFYGASETSFVTISETDTPQGSVGRPYPGVTIDIRDPSGKSLGISQEGLVWIHSPYLFSGYGKATDTGAKQDGRFVSVGEAGLVDAAGNLYISGRADRMITIADQNVYPEKVEQVLEQMPGVIKAVAVCVPDTKRGAHFVAALKLDASAPPIEDILKNARKTLGPLRAPKSAVVVEDWPTLPSGKSDLATLAKIIRGAKT